MHAQVADYIMENSPSNREAPAMPSYRELMEARQKRLEEKSKSHGNFTATIKNLESSSSPTKLPSLQQKPSQQALLKKLNYDFGSLKEFLSYDLKLKKPEDLFKASENKKKSDVKNKEEELKKGLLKHMIQEVDLRDIKTILLEEKDPEKVQKAAKRFIQDMMSEIFKGEVEFMEKKLSQKGANRLYELIMDLEEENPVRKIVEKYWDQPLATKFDILEEMERKKNSHVLLQSSSKNGKALGNSKKSFMASSGLYHSSSEVGMNYSGIDGQKRQNMLSNRNKNIQGYSQRRLLKAPGLPGQSVNFNINEDPSGMNALKTGIAKPRREFNNAERISFAYKLVINSPSLAMIYETYEKEDKEQYSKEVKAAEDLGQCSFKDVFEMKDDERNALIGDKSIIFTHVEKSPMFFFHLTLNYPDYSTLMALNVRGCGLSEGVIYFMVKMIEKFSPDIKLLDVSQNHVSVRVCETIKEILMNNQLKTLKMAATDINRKGMAIVCLGLAKNMSVTEIDFNYNDIDEYGFKTLGLILRHTRTLQSIKLLPKKRKGEEGVEELKLVHFAILEKVRKYNPTLDLKKIQLFEREPSLAI